MWSDLSASLGELAGVWQDDPAYDGIKALRRKLYGATGARLGWLAKDGEPPLDALLRPTVLSALVKSDHAETVAEALKQFALYAEAQESGTEPAVALPVDLRSTIVQAAVKNGGEAEWQRVLALYRKSDMQEEKIRLMTALGATKDAALRLKTLEWGFSDDVRNQDLFYVVAACANSDRNQTWQFVKDNWDEFFKRFGEGQFLLARIVSLATKGFASLEKADDIEAFFKGWAYISGRSVLRLLIPTKKKQKNAAHPCPPAERTIQQSLEAVRAKAAWYNRDKAAVAKWLATEG